MGLVAVFFVYLFIWFCISLSLYFFGLFILVISFVRATGRGGTDTYIAQDSRHRRDE